MHSRLALTIVSIIIMTSGCTKLRVDSNSVSVTDKIPTPHLTAHINYQRNAIGREQIEPPISLLWDQEYISLPNRGFTALDDFLIFGSYRGHTVFVDVLSGKQKGKENFGDSCPVPPTLYGSLLYQSFESGSDGLVVYDFIEGVELWQVENLLSSSSPVVYNNMVCHLSLNGILTCYHYRTGEIIWRKDLESRIKNSPAFENNTLIASTIDGDVFAFEYSSGVQLWKSNLNTPMFANPVLAHNRVYVGGYDGTLYIFDVQNGSILYRYNFSTPLYVSPTIDRENIYVPLSDGRLIAYNRTTFAKVWSFSAKGPPADAVLVSDQYAYLTSLENRFYILDKMNGILLQEIELDGRPRSTPLISGGRLFISCEDNRIQAYAAQNDSI